MGEFGLSKHVCWWLSPQLRRAGGMFLVKLLAPTGWRADGFTYRSTSREPVPIRVCDHWTNSNHPAIGEEFLASPRDLIAVQYGYRNN